MSSLIDISKQWEGRIVDGKFPLQKWLGGSVGSAVFLTERSVDGFQKAALKLIPAETCSAENLKEEAQLFRWADIAKLSHPHLIRLFESGRCQIDGTSLLYVVMEYAEEDLSQVVPLRSLSTGEVQEMLPPTVDALVFLHHAGFVQGHMKPSNVMAVSNQLKISADHLRKTGERETRESTVYDAPELASMGFSPAADVWSLGVMLVAILTQHEPVRGRQQIEVAVPDAVPEPFREIARRCLQVQPQRRGTLDEVLGKLKVQETAPPGSVEQPRSVKRTEPWLILPIVVVLLLLAVLFGRKFMIHQPQLPAAETHAPESPTAPANSPATPAPAPFPEKPLPAPTGSTAGSVLQQVLPQVSRGAQNTIQGHVKVGVQLSVDASGNVSQATLISPGPSKYFANQALAAARRWKFQPPQKDGQATASEWILRFQFGRTSTQVFPAQIKR
ncbi:MAG: TonB family protein [Candidatus Sulfotelmatobacter sp.]|jgi:TonB family protein